MKLKRNDKGQLVAEYPGLTLTISGPMADKFNGIDPEVINFSVYSNFVNMSAYISLSEDTNSYKKGLDAPTPSPEVKASPNQEDTFNVASEVEEVKEAV